MVYWLNLNLMFLIGFLFIIMGVMVSVMFYVLMERKMLSLIQLRKGPNKVLFLGLFQSASDGMKLFLKEFFFPLNSNMNIFYFSPFFFLLLFMFLLISFPYFCNYINYYFSLIYMLVLMGVSVYFVIFSGWFSNSLYSVIGSIRMISQMISYEVSLIFYLFLFSYFFYSFNLYIYLSSQLYVKNFFLFFPIFFFFLVIMISESNRTPFDFAEGESELVSGFNTEYGGVGFSLLFICEYGMIIFMSFIINFVFFGSMVFFFFFFFGMVICYFYLYIRGVFPRYRYDKLMMMAWLILLPYSLVIYFFYISFLYLLYS